MSLTISPRTVNSASAGGSASPPAGATVRLQALENLAAPGLVAHLCEIGLRQGEAWVELDRVWLRVARLDRVEDAGECQRCLEINVLYSGRVDVAFLD
jgi:hypothetical protein